MVSRQSESPRGAFATHLTPSDRPADDGAPRAEPDTTNAPESVEAGAEPRPTLAGIASAEVAAMRQREAEIEAAMARSLRGEALSQRELLELQACVYRYGQQVDVASRVIDRTSAALRQLLNTQL